MVSIVWGEWLNASTAERGTPKRQMIVRRPVLQLNVVIARPQTVAIYGPDSSSRAKRGDPSLIKRRPGLPRFTRNNAASTRLTPPSYTPQTAFPLLFTGSAFP